MVVLCPYPQGCAPSQRLKFEQYYDSWRAEGFEVEVRPFWDRRSWEVLYAQGHRVHKVAGLLRGLARRIADARAALGADIVYLHLEAAPVGPPWLERRLARRKVPVVYDIDDLIYVPHSSASNPFMRRLRSTGKVAKLMTWATEVVVCTSYLEEYARSFNDRVTNISSTIDTEAYAPPPRNQARSPVVVGWSGSHSTSVYLHLLDDVLRELQHSDGVRVKVIGDGRFSIPEVQVDAQEWRLDTEVADLSAIDIGVYPLPQEEWVKGKSGLKALQYMALEIPTVAQRASVNPTIIDHGVTGYLAGDPEEWLDALRKLVRDPELRRVVGRRARQVVVERYSVSVTAPSYLAVLRRAMDDVASAAQREPRASR
ncbi:MAG: glycosyltransferase family 4 protein [Acidimicrobiales bacterium]